MQIRWLRSDGGLLMAHDQVLTLREILPFFDDWSAHSVAPVLDPRTKTTERNTSNALLDSIRANPNKVNTR